MAVLLRAMPSGLARLEHEGQLRLPEGDLLGLTPVRPPEAAVPPSDLVTEGRAEGRSG